MRKIVIFCDGTWNNPKMLDTTSVFELYEAIENDSHKGQLCAYFPGIGNEERFDSSLQRFLRRYGGGAFGWGLDAKVKQAYQFISKCYQPGDEIYLFGFSRGAYTARSVAGMLRKCGIVSNTSVAGINKAFKLYRKRGKKNHPDKPHILKERLEVSPRFATSPDDLKWRNDDGSELVNIAYLGVFDTVGARGIPPALFGPIATLWNSQYRFHDTDLSSLVRSARHAIAVDERRVFFKPARWGNLLKLNAGHRKDDPLRPYQQSWFLGDHSTVGGSTAGADALSVIPQQWILSGAGSLALKPGHGPDPSKADPLLRTSGIDHSSKIFSQWRTGPQLGDDVHPSVVQRVKSDATYRPKTLRRNIEAWLSFS